MTVTPLSLLSSLVSSVLLTVFAWVILKYDSALKMAGKQIGIFLALIIARILLPVEFNFTVTLRSRYILTRLQDLMRLELEIGGIEITVGQALLVLWVLGAVCKFVIYVGRYIHLSRVIGKCPGYFKYDVEAMIAQINRECGKKGRFQVLLLPGIQTPAVFGLAYPKILMPMINYSEEEMYYILKHEMLHYYHHDMLVKILCEFIGIIYWWNPVVFLLNQLIARVLEIRVDAILTSRFSECEKTSYLECIVKSMRAGKQEKKELMITFAAQKEEVMKQRFRCICENHWQRKSWKHTFLTICSCLLFLMTISVVMEPDYDADIPGTFDCPTPENAYLVRKEVGYLIYVDGEFVGEALEISEPLADIKIYRGDQALRYQ